MVCYVEPWEREQADLEIESKKRKKHLDDLFEYVSEAIALPDIRLIPEDGGSLYSAKTRMLCTACKNMSEKLKDKLMYDGRNRMARKLADWWENHQRQDTKREARERKKAEFNRIRKKALTKLSAKERKALGLD